MKTFRMQAVILDIDSLPHNRSCRRLFPYSPFRSPLRTTALLLIYAAVAQFEEYAQAGPENLKTAGRTPAETAGANSPGLGRTVPAPDHQHNRVSGGATHRSAAPPTPRSSSLPGGREPPPPAQRKEAGPPPPAPPGPSGRLARPPGKPPSPHPGPGPAPSFPGLLPVGSTAPFASPTLSAPPGSRSAGERRLARRGASGTPKLARARRGPPLPAGLAWATSRRPPPRHGRGPTSPPVSLGQVVPGLMPGVVSAAGAQVRRLDEPPAPLRLQHHLQLREGLAVPLPPLVVQSPTAHHIAGSCLADFTLDIALGARRIRLTLVCQVAKNGPVAFLA